LLRVEIVFHTALRLMLDWALTNRLGLLQVLHIHVFLGVQDLLCVWIHASCLHHTCRRHCLCYHRLHLLPSECRGLSVVSSAEGSIEK